MNKDALLMKAETMFGEKNCAQTVLMCCAEYFGIADEAFEHITAPFGGGLCGTRVSVCGAVTGAVMFIGLKERDKAKSTETGRELIKFVETRYGHRCCEKILDIDFNDAEQVAREKDEKGKTICMPLIKDICLWIADRYDG